MWTLGVIANRGVVLFETVLFENSIDGILRCVHLGHERVLRVLKEES